MAKLSGQYLTVNIDDSGDTARAVSSDIESVDIPTSTASWMSPASLTEPSTASQACRLSTWRSLGISTR
jgi:hypothetical protein